MIGDFLGLLWGTVVLRPYVFLFLAAYLLLATWHLGLGRALLFLLAGYLLAWGSELSSIHTGFPYGRYIYIEATRNQELWVLGVPFMDSLSYVFLSYASYTLAWLALSPGLRSRGDLMAQPQSLLAGRELVLASVLMVMLDVVIDPVALRGYRWFLGQIYGYPEYGIYFGVPLSNFFGWLLVGAVLLLTLQQISRLSGRNSWLDWGKRHFRGQAWLGPALYVAILAFNLWVAFRIGETLLGLVGCFIYIPFLTLLGLSLLPRRRAAEDGNALRKAGK